MYYFEKSDILFSRIPAVRNMDCDSCPVFYSPQTTGDFSWQANIRAAN
jgi:hypothetical protein